MTTAEKIIFVSCGQATGREKKLGLAVKNLIDNRTGFRAYFAETVSSFDALTSEVFGSLSVSSGAVILMHPRGRVKPPKGNAFERASVWLHQEIAILAYMSHAESIKIPALALCASDLKREGAMSNLILNARALPPRKKEVLDAVSDWLSRTDFPARRASKLDRFSDLLRDATWRREVISNHTKFFCTEDEMYNVVVGEQADPFNEPWANRFPDDTNTAAHWVYLNYGEHTLKELRFVFCDGARYDLPMPRPGAGGSPYYNAEWIECQTARMMAANSVQPWDYNAAVRRTGLIELVARRRTKRRS